MAEAASLVVGVVAMPMPEVLVLAVKAVSSFIGQKGTKNEIRMD